MENSMNPDGMVILFLKRVSSRRMGGEFGQMAFLEKAPSLS
jgi:hypothetical protein